MWGEDCSGVVVKEALDSRVPFPPRPRPLLAGYMYVEWVHALSRGRNGPGPKKAIIFTIPRGLTADIVRSTAKQGDRGVVCKSNKKRPEPRYRTFFFARRITEPKQEVEDVDRPPSKGRKVGRGGGLWA